MERISSRTNPLVKRFRSAAAPSGDTILLDGAHLLDEALAAGVTVDVVAVPDRLTGNAAGALARRAGQHGARLIAVSDQVLSAISPARQPPGPVAIARRPAATLDAALRTSPQLILVLAGVQDPGNVGAVIRVAEACGATGIIAGEGTADAFGWKALRGSMGSAFRLAVTAVSALPGALDAVRARQVRLVAAVPRGGTPLPRCDLGGPIAILLGGEGAGLADPLLSLADARLSIPMAQQVDSLNVATAAAIITYEAMRQRQGSTP